MRLLRSLAIAFSTYSKIPMPQVPFEDENMRFSLCFFPLIGCVVGGAVFGWLWLSAAIGAGPVLRGALSAALPLLISGGIHMDGFMDTIDALAACQPRDRRLEILTDSHTGAFAVIGCAGFLLVYAGAMAEVGDLKVMGVVSLSFVLSRALSGTALLTLKSAKPSGLLSAFKHSAQTRDAKIALLIWAGASAAGMIALSPIVGALSLVGACVSLIYYRRMAYRQFGGVTGDLAGFFLQTCELLSVLFAVLGARLL